jgi:hypothetical protein
MQQQVHHQRDPDDVGRQYDLGRFQTMYTMSDWWWWVNAIGIVFGAAVVLYTLPPVLANQIQPENLMFLALGGIFLLFMLFVTLIDVYKQLKHGRSYACIYAEGFVYGRSKGEIQHQHVIRWVDVESFTHTVSQPAYSGAVSTNSYRITCKNMKPFGLDTKLGYKFVTAVESAVVDHLYPSAQAAYLSGNVVHFGRLDVSQEGLYDTKKKAMLPWKEVESVRLGTSTYIRKRGKKKLVYWLSADGKELKNVKVLRRLIEEYVVPMHGVKLIP